MLYIITIIVLIIVGGISCYLLFSDNGIIERAKWAKFVTEFTEIEEK